MREAIVSIAAGRSQLALFEAAERLGLAVVALDRDPDAPGFERAAAHAVVSTHDAGAALDALQAVLAQRSDLRPVGVLTKSSGPPVATAARVAAALDLPGLDPALARELVSKPGQLRAAVRAGLRVPARWDGGRLEPDVLARLDPPLVVKPAVTREGKRAVQRIDHRRDLPAATDAAARASGDGRFEVEQYLPGRDLVLCATFVDSRAGGVVAIEEDTRFGADGTVRGVGLRVTPQGQGAAGVDAAADAVRCFVRALRLGTGMGLWTFRVADGERPALIELHLDLAGDLVTDWLLPSALSHDPIELALRNAIGWGAELPPVNRAAAVRFLSGDEARAAAALTPHEREAYGLTVDARAVEAGAARCGNARVTADDDAGLVRRLAALERALTTTDPSARPSGDGVSIAGIASPDAERAPSASADGSIS